MVADIITHGFRYGLFYRALRRVYGGAEAISGRRRLFGLPTGKPSGGLCSAMIALRPAGDRQ